MKRLHEWGGAPPRRSQKLRKTVRRMKNCGCTDWAILHEIRFTSGTIPRTEAEQTISELGISCSLAMQKAETAAESRCLPEVVYRY